MVCTLIKIKSLFFTLIGNNIDRVTIDIKIKHSYPNPN
jgi:hypothetical protein